jgi:hypothetical protein
MRVSVVFLLTWLTVAAAIGSAVWLATVDSGRPFMVREGHSLGEVEFKLPDQATSAGKPASQPDAPAF